jgi:hypothetical protein
VKHGARVITTLIPYFVFMPDRPRNTEEHIFEPLTEKETRVVVPGIVCRHLRVRGSSVEFPRPQIMLSLRNSIVDNGEVVPDDTI